VVVVVEEGFFCYLGVRVYDVEGGKERRRCNLHHSMNHVIC